MRLNTYERVTPYGSKIGRSVRADTFRFFPRKKNLPLAYGWRFFGKTPNRKKMLFLKDSLKTDVRKMI